MELHPHNEEEAQILDKELSKLAAFQSAENFIILNNEGKFNNESVEVKKVREKITLVYKNVSLLRNGKFHIRSLEEYELETAMLILKFCPMVVKLKRIANDIINVGHSADTKLIFLENKKKSCLVYLEKEVRKNDETHYELNLHSNEKMFPSNRDFVNNIFLRNNIKIYDNPKYKGLNMYITVEDILSINTDFILKSSVIVNSIFNINYNS